MGAHAVDGVVGLVWCAWTAARLADGKTCGARIGCVAAIGQRWCGGVAQSFGGAEFLAKACCLPTRCTKLVKRDYFFLLWHFWAWGLLAGAGIAWTAARLTHRMPKLIGNGVRAAALMLAAVPLIANEPAMNRTRAPESLLPRNFARLLLDAAPGGAVLLVAGDNDTFPAVVSAKRGALPGGRGSGIGAVAGGEVVPRIAEQARARGATCGS